MLTLLIGGVLLNGYAVALVLLRAGMYRTRLYRPMLWNVFLSILPVVVLAGGGIAGLLLFRLLSVVGVIVLIVTAVVWILLLPNASYLITELNQSHRSAEDTVPLWYDIVLVISLAMSGVVNTVINILVVHLLGAVMIDDDAESLLSPALLILVALVILLISFGMYLGRYLRFNSWDLRHPAAFAKKFFTHFRDRNSLLASVGFTLTYAVFIGLIYYLLAGTVIENLLELQQARIALL